MKVLFGLESAYENCISLSTVKKRSTYMTFNKKDLVSVDKLLKGGDSNKYDLIENPLKLPPLYTLELATKFN